MYPEIHRQPRQYQQSFRSSDQQQHPKTQYGYSHERQSIAYGAEIRSRWFKDQSRVPVGLYAANGCRSGGCEA